MIDILQKKRTPSQIQQLQIQPHLPALPVWQNLSDAAFFDIPGKNKSLSFNSGIKTHIRLVAVSVLYLYYIKFKVFNTRVCSHNTALTVSASGLELGSILAENSTTLTGTVWDICVVQIRNYSLSV